MPTVSIIIPTYNGRQYIEETLQSLYDQTLTDWEAIVIDDGSSDNTCEIVKQFASRDARFRYQAQRNQGVAKARNAGYRAVSDTSSRVLFLDHDDTLRPDSLQYLSNMLDEDQRASAVYGFSKIISEDVDEKYVRQLQLTQVDQKAVISGKLRAWPAYMRTTRDVFAVRCHIVTPGQVMFRRSSLDRAMPFDQAVAPCDDWDMYYKITGFGHMRFVPEYVMNHRRHGNNASLNRLHMFLRAQRAYRKHYLMPDTTPEQRINMRLAYKITISQTAQYCAAMAQQDISSRNLIQAFDHMVQYCYLKYCAKFWPTFPLTWASSSVNGRKLTVND